MRSRSAWSISTLTRIEFKACFNSIVRREKTHNFVYSKHNSMSTEPTKLSDQEITQYREQFAEYPEALDALDLIAENDGDLKESASLLALEAGVEIVKGVPNILDELAQKSRKAVCDDAFDELMAGLLGAAMGTLAATGQLPKALATSVVIYIARIGVKKFCSSGNG